MLDFQKILIILGGELVVNKDLAKLNVYRELRRNSRKVDDEGGYVLGQGEMNPMIWKWFGRLLCRGQRVWEPFANPDGRSFKQADELGLELVSTSLVGGHPRIMVGDSTADDPDGMFDGVLFHPPYFGTRKFTDDPRDLSNAMGELDWKVGIECVVETIFEKLNSEGVVCAVGRRYRHGGKEIKMDEWLVKRFGRKMICIDVWSSEPDVVIIFRLKEK